MDNEIKLTLDPNAALGAAAAQEAPKAPDPTAAKPVEEAKPVENKPLLDESQFTEAERRAINSGKRFGRYDGGRY